MKRVVKLICIVLCIAMLAVCIVGCGSSSSSRRSSSSSKSGFVGSDGKYHPYVPAFGDDVNNWMKDNW